MNRSGRDFILWAVVAADRGAYGGDRGISPPPVFVPPFSRSAEE
jgi:hypothetical protein